VSVSIPITCYPAIGVREQLGDVEVWRAKHSGALLGLGELALGDLERLVLTTAVAMVNEANLQHGFCISGVCTHCDFVAVVETLISARETAPIPRQAPEAK
jgi:hypothetical protein